ncbi:hypothetical protein BJ138DRAFT_1147384 [Hygrophoropsis aurantiaca]|uniref:Uncharacterized protein n=1 Tax=Hygrophoropsis aurantiaca TaxID=72124 RepID=A0ACB8AHL2_9AGAM|nr:hypothetical protein BJ138DRAFT_1147384 [Hygrophoropsis aurantiaca]
MIRPLFRMLCLLVMGSRSQAVDEFNDIAGPNPTARGTRSIVQESHYHNDHRQQVLDQNNGMFIFCHDQAFWQSAVYGDQSGVRVG